MQKAIIIYENMIYEINSIMKHIPFTYLIGWSKHNRYYYGVRYKQGCNPGELWTRYFTSSKLVHEFRSKYGEPDIIEVRKTFSSSVDAVNWETKVLSRLDVLNESKWLNANINLAQVQTPEVRKRKSEGMLRANIKRTDEFKQKLSTYAKNRTAQHTANWLASRLGRPQSEEAKQKQSESMKGRHWYNDGTRAVLSKECPEGFVPGRLPN